MEITQRYVDIEGRAITLIPNGFYAACSIEYQGHPLIIQQ